MHLRQTGWLAMLLVIGMTSWGCSQDAPEAEETRTLSEVMQDAPVTAGVKVSLALQSGVRAIGINVDTHDGTVTLSGTVSSESERQLAEKVAEDVEGVKDVVNRLAIQS